MINLKIKLALIKKPLGFPIFSAFIFFSILWLLDFPKPQVDDLFFCGSALNLAGGGDFTNPFIAWLPGHLYFFQPPVHTYVLTLWLKVFGISAAALTGFQAAAYFLNAAAIIAILHRYSSPAWLKYLTPLLLTASFAAIGLRQEPLATAFALVGFAIIECDIRKPSLVFLSFLLMFLGMATAPRVTLFAGALAILAGQRLWVENSDNKQRRKLFWLAASACLFTGLIFLWMIHFQAAEFWHIFFLTAKSVSVRRPLGSYFLAQLGSIQIVLMLTCGMLLAFLFKYRREKSIQLSIALALVFPAQFFLHFLGNGVGRYFLSLALFFSITAILKHISRLNGRGLMFGLICFLVFMNSGLFVNIFGIVTGEIKSTHEGDYHEAKQLASTEQTPLFLDPFAARYVFDYKMPRGSVDFFFSPPFPRYIIDETNYPEGNYVFGPQWGRGFRQTNEPSDSQWGFLNWRFYKKPQQIFVIHHY